MTSPKEKPWALSLQGASLRDSISRVLSQFVTGGTGMSSATSLGGDSWKLERGVLWALLWTLFPFLSVLSIFWLY